MEALRTDVRRQLEASGRVVTSVFVGGGTPTRVPAASLVGVLAAIPLAPGAEVTVEANPDDVTDELVDAYVAGGVNRISLGVQSTVPDVLASLGRTHTPANVVAAVASFRRAGLATFNLDLIYGAAGERVDDWRSTLDTVAGLAPPHVSAYALTVEPGTPLAEDASRHPDDDDLADKYELADDMLGAIGLANYEVSNWAAAGHECRHNLLYWHQGDYLGFGSAAHSHQAGYRFWNLRTPERYIAAVEAGESTVAAGEHLDPATRRLEALQLALRLADGVPRDEIDTDGLGDLVGDDGVRVRLTRRGRLLANEVSMHLR